METLNISTKAYAWEATYTRSWDTVREDESGSLQGAVDELMARGRRKRCVVSTAYFHGYRPYENKTILRLLFPSTAIRRTIIRHLILALDLSASMMDRDMRPTRFDLTLEYARAFVVEWFDQNPLGQIGVIGMRGGVAERIGEMSSACPLLSINILVVLLTVICNEGNPTDVLNALKDRHKLEPAGEPSLQNAIEMARGSMRYAATSFLSHYLMNQGQPSSNPLFARDSHHIRLTHLQRSREYT